MAVVVLRSPLRELAGGDRQVEVPGGSVVEVLRALERAHPRVAGWVLDERGSIRRHVAVFLNGEQVMEDSAVDRGDRLHVLPSISGGGR